MWNLFWLQWSRKSKSPDAVSKTINSNNPGSFTFHPCTNAKTTSTSASIGTDSSTDPSTKTASNPYRRMQRLVCPCRFSMVSKMRVGHVQGLRILWRVSIAIASACANTSA